MREGAALRAEPAHPWVSRGGVKLAAALDHFRVDPSGASCLDVGASTGGFTEVLLARGARHVHAVEVGRDQFHPSLRADPRVSLREQTDARALTPADIPDALDLIAVDVSFISLRLVVPPVSRFAAPGARLVALVKPQFEAGPRAAKKGVVRDPAVHDAVCRVIEDAVSGAGWAVDGIVPSPIRGRNGNREFLLAARRRADGHGADRRRND